MDLSTERVTKIIEAAGKLKHVMREKRILRAKAKCPFCEQGYLHGVLAGRKQHLHMRCDGCDVFMME